MQRLARLIGMTTLETTDPDEWENRKETDTSGTVTQVGVPAGYTYLLQLAMHDLVQTSIPIMGISGSDRPVRNLRNVGLNLQTLFGGGPAVCPFAYANSSYKEFRREMKLGPTEGAKPGQSAPPIRDLVRVSSTDYASDTNKEVGDVMIADPRNEDTVILAQLTALFHAFHNVVENRMLNTYGENISGEHGEVVGDVGVCSRAVTSYVFRQIVWYDLMQRILDSDVFDAYETDPIFLDQDDNLHTASIEFAQAVSRVGHQMVRPTYWFNQQDDSEHNLMSIFRKKTYGNSPPPQGSFPLSPEWVIDWDLFFETDNDQTGSSKFNWAARFSPRISNFFMNPTFFLAALRWTGIQVSRWPRVQGSSSR